MAKTYDTFNPVVFDRIPAGSRVLDIGCATGRLGQRLREVKPPSFLAGLEQDSEMAKIAAPFYDQLVVDDLERAGDLLFEKNSFDVVVCADVLEHLRDSRRAIEKLSALMSRDGIMLISVPNIAFIQVRLALLLGIFAYSPHGGTMDESHLRFFTRKTLAQLIANSGLRVASIRGYNVVRRRYYFLKLLASFWPGLFALQYLAEARKHE